MIKRSVYLEELTLLNVYAPDQRPAKYLKQLLIYMKKDIEGNTIVVEDFNKLLSPLDRSSRLKLNKEILYLKEEMEESFLGKGGFAKCFEISDADSKEVFAGKIVPKSLLLKPHQKEKMSMEIAIHRSLAHQHVVGFHGFFEDNDFVFVVLELCRRRSLLELHKRRKALTEPEARYYLRQIILGCQYLHQNRVIHRDLKLGNLFLNEDLEVKIGDFGLATRVEYDGERKKTLCGTPNYIAPEVLRFLTKLTSE
ncbi:serine/threonine-protein kinase PLK1-like [Sorex fumeus]|uniref:serine/threonine-protein kinase PLK1-like n=1 Tax=Sorex fumeus TaxID=62283 RepID=UPI0024ACA024|nr:serine/threonine-protein kinase PLK1-like [Sorex fumeus]